jgi:hypothetical protein
LAAHVLSEEPFLKFANCGALQLLLPLAKKAGILANTTKFADQFLQ